MLITRKTRDRTPLKYVERVNIAIDHILSHLDQPLRLNVVSKATGLSPFHFHRVFQSLVGETVTDFIKRNRLDRSLSLMAIGKRKAMTDIALACGFTSSSDFSRCFKQRHGVPPSAFDIAGWRKTHAADLEAMVNSSALHHLTNLPDAKNPDNFKVSIRKIPARTVAYIRVRNPYRSNGVPAAIDRLMKWAERRGFAQGQWLGYQWDNPEVVPLEDCSYYVAVTADGFSPSGEIGRYRFPELTVAQIEIRGSVELELRALQWFYSDWLPRSRYLPDDQPCFEAWIGIPNIDGSNYYELHAQLPVRHGG